MIVSLIRHGSTTWNEEGRMQGRRDVPLSERGRAQVRAWRVPSPSPGPALWMSSPLRRAAETAEVLCGRPVPQEHALVEMDWGEWEGLTLDDLRARHGAEFDRNEARGLDFRPPRGESPRDVLERLRPWLMRANASAEPVVAVTHLGVLRVMLAAATGWDMTGKAPVRLRGDALHRFAVDGRGRVSIVECNVPLVAGPGADAP
jgi:broad specificity phosphatase PhoE